MGKMLRISNDFSSEAFRLMLLKFYVEPPWGRGIKDCYNGHGPFTKMAAMPIYGKKTLESFSPEPNKPRGQIFAQIIGDRSSTKIAKMMVLH